MVPLIGQAIQTRSLARRQLPYGGSKFVGRKRKKQRRNSGRREGRDRKGIEEGRTSRRVKPRSCIYPTIMGLNVSAAKSSRKKAGARRVTQKGSGRSVWTNAETGEEVDRTGLSFLEPTSSSAEQCAGGGDIDVGVQSVVSRGQGRRTSRIPDTTGSPGRSKYWRVEFRRREATRA